MCGIVGYAGSPDPRYLAAMNRVQEHRGPDDSGTWSDERGNVHFGMRRLSILDIDGGAQPMRLRDFTIVFNGEIFNAPELRAELEKNGAKFSTDHSDTEVLLHLYAAKGAAMLDHLNGMFAFVIHDKERGTIFGARDPFGIKPLHYSTVKGFAFASEIKSLLTLPWIGKDLDNQSLYDFFTVQAIPPPRTTYRDIRKLPAGHAFTYDLARGKLSVQPYFQPKFAPPVEGSRAEIGERVRSGFLAAVKKWSLSDVPIAVSLSGGIDSAAVTAALATQSDQPIHTYTLGFEDAPDLDERAAAKLTAEKYGTKHHEIVIRERDLLAALPAMINALDEPYAGGLPSWFIFKHMAKDVKVGLTGSGGDELFHNYGKWAAFTSLRKRWLRSKAYLRSGGSLSDLLLYPHGALHYPYFTDRFKTEELLMHSQEGTEKTCASLERLWQECPSSHSMNRIAYVDLELQLPEEFLMMTDRFSMAHSLEARTPFLDRDFAAFILRIPPKLRIDPHRPKRLFIDAVKDLLPEQLLSIKKRGFTLPVGAWMRGELKERIGDLCGKDFLRRQGIFRPETVAHIAADHLAGKDNTWELWTILNFQMWQTELDIL